MSRSSVITIHRVPKEHLSRYGIVKGEGCRDNLLLLEDIVEKPRPKVAPSHFGSIGRYVFSPALFSCLKDIPKGAGGEIQLTDAIRLLKKKEDVYAFLDPGRWFDTGDKLGHIETITDYVLEDKTVHTQLQDQLQEFQDRMRVRG